MPHLPLQPYRPGQEHTGLPGLRAYEEDQRTLRWQCGVRHGLHDVWVPYAKVLPANAFGDQREPPREPTRQMHARLASSSAGMVAQPRMEDLYTGWSTPLPQRTLGEECAIIVWTRHTRVDEVADGWECGAYSWREYVHELHRYDAADADFVLSRWLNTKCLAEWATEALRRDPWPL